MCCDGRVRADVGQQVVIYLSSALEEMAGSGVELRQKFVTGYLVLPTQLRNIDLKTVSGARRFPSENRNRISQSLLIFQPIAVDEFARGDALFALWLELEDFKHAAVSAANQ